LGISESIYHFVILLVSIIICVNTVHREHLALKSKAAGQFPHILMFAYFMFMNK